MRINRILMSLTAVISVAGVSSQDFQVIDSISLVPEQASTAPDYMCTWNLQGYITAYGSSEDKRKAMNESSLLGYGPYEGWARFYPRIRKDLILVMDDSWDIPAEANVVSGNRYLGLAELDEERFPSFSGTPAERLRALSDSVKALGWRGLGGWICAQKAGSCSDEDETAYWTRRLDDARESGFAYWKVDWGRQDHNIGWRRMLSALGREHAPELVIEHALEPECIMFSEVYRTYDVENIIAQPVTISRVCSMLPFRADDGAAGIINCEDEPYIAAGLGCAIGIMRHPFAGDLPDGSPDHAFPATCRDLKRRLDEVERGVRWHRIARPFGVDGDYRADSVILEDAWEFRPKESWVRHEPGSMVRASAPARVSRRMELPKVADASPTRPYVLASAYPGGAVAVASIGRTLGRDYLEDGADVEIAVGDIHAPVGVFGVFRKLTITFDGPMPDTILAQDLIADHPVDITAYADISAGRISIPGSILRAAGLMGATPGDISSPALVLKIL